MPRIYKTKGTLRGVALSYLLTPKCHRRVLLLLGHDRDRTTSSFGSIHLYCEDDYRYQFSGQLGCLADQEKDCSRWWQIVSFRGLEIENPEVRWGADAGVRGVRQGLLSDGYSAVNLRRYICEMCPLLPVAENGSGRSRRRSESGKLPLLPFSFVVPMSTWWRCSHAASVN